jgi:hypothetical protein
MISTSFGRRAALAYQLILALLALPAASRAQATSDAKPKTIELDNLKTPVSPGFEILGVAPTAIERPTTPRALALGLLSASSNGSVLPRDYAVEVAPYWLRPRPTLTFAQYVAPTVAQSIAQSFGISFATARGGGVGVGSDTGATRLGVGVRAMFNAGRPSARLLALDDTHDAMQRTRIPTIRTLADAMDAADSLEGVVASATASGDASAVAAARTALRGARERIDDVQHTLDVQADSMRRLALAMGDERSERVGFFTQAAAALAASFPGSTVEGGKLTRAGAWGTAGYRLEHPHLDVIVLARYLRQTTGAEASAFDAGARLVWMSGPFGLSGELVHRAASTETETGVASSVAGEGALRTSNRAVASLELKLRDDLYVSTSFGQDHATGTDDRHPLVAILGLHVQLGAKPSVVLPRATP